MLASSRSMRTETIPAIRSPCFLVATPGSTAMHVGLDCGEVNKKTQNHSGSIPNMENTLERIAKCQSKTKEDTHSGFWQVDLTPAAQELLAFGTPKGRVFRWKVMPFGVANGPALFQELMNKILYILIPRPLVQILGSRGAEMDADIKKVSLHINTQESVCQENHLCSKLEESEFMREEMEFPGFDIGYGWWKAAASRMQACKTCRYVMTLRKVFTTSGVLLGRTIFTGAVYTSLHIHQPPLLT